jgi:hypothetical protein
MPRNARDDLDDLLDESCKTAIHFLEKSHEFFPFAVVAAVPGERQHVQAYDGRERPPSEDVLRLLVAGLRERAERGELLAAALTREVCLTDRLTGEKTDAIAVALEHRNAAPIECFIPYRFEDGRVVCGEISAHVGTSQVFLT